MQKQEHEASKVIAEYDGWKLIHQAHGHDIFLKDGETVTDFGYATHIEWLWPVAKKVHAELSKEDMANAEVIVLTDMIEEALCEFDLAALVRAVHEAVGFINNNKKK